MVVCPDPVTSITLDLDIIERNLFDDNLLTLWASLASDLALYEQFKKNSDGEDLCLMNNQGHTCYHLFNTSESQLWADGVKFYRFSCPRNVSGFWNSKKCVFLSNVMVSLTLF